MPVSVDILVIEEILTNVPSLHKETGLYASLPLC